MLIERPCIEFLRTSRQVFLDAFRERWSRDGVRLDLRHQRCTQCFCAFQIRELRALSRDDIALRSATMNPDRALAVHPKAALGARDTALVDRALPKVSFVQNEAFYSLRHPLSVRVLVHDVKPTL